uniref:Uncharacterized protein n=1 Tax=Monopterus albus TaxID=43700 RepID=A0A3Q3JUB7_MONAL
MALTAVLDPQTSLLTPLAYPPRSCSATARSPSPRRDPPNLEPDTFDVVLTGKTLLSLFLWIASGVVTRAWHVWLTM